MDENQPVYDFAKADHQIARIIEVRVYQDGRRKPIAILRPATDEEVANGETMTVRWTAEGIFSIE